MDEINPAELSDFARWLIDARTDRDMTRKDLAAASSVSLKAIQNIETGITQSPSVLIRKRLSRALGSGQTPTAVEIPESTIAPGTSGVLFRLPNDPVDAIQLLTRLLQEQAEKMRADPND